MLSVGYPLGQVSTDMMVLVGECGRVTLYTRAERESLGVPRLVGEGDSGSVVTVT